MLQVPTIPIQCFNPRPKSAVEDYHNYSNSVNNDIISPNSTLENSMFLKEILREIRLTLIQINESRYWGLWFLALVALCGWIWLNLGKG